MELTTRSLESKISAVIKIGGEVIDNYLGEVCDYLAFCAASRAYTPVVYGWGKTLTTLLTNNHIKSEWHAETQDRITTPEMMPFVEAVSYEYGSKIVAECSRKGAKAQLCQDIFQAAQKELPGIAYKHFNGVVVGVDTGKICSLVREGIIPVVSSLGHYHCVMLNMNGDSAAKALVLALKPANYINITLVGCVLNRQWNTIPKIRLEAEYQQLLDRGVVSGGMKKKLDEALDTLRAMKSEGHSTNIKIIHPQKLFAKPGEADGGTMLEL